MSNFKGKSTVVPLVLLVAGLGLIATASCDGKSGDNAADALKEAGKLADQVQQALDVQDLALVKEVAAIAAEIEKAPDETAAILENHGVSREKYDEMLAKIEGNEKLKKAYDKVRESL